MPAIFATPRRLSALSLAIACALPTVAFANTSPVSDTGSEKASDDTLTVVATGNQRSSFSAPMMVTVIDGTSPQAQTAGTAGDLLRQVPGITVTGTGRSNGQDIMMRGYDRRGVLTLVDGVRQGTDTGHLNGTFLDPALIKRVEVVRGPSALLYGIALTPAGKKRRVLVVDDMALLGFGLQTPDALIKLRRAAEQP